MRRSILSALVWGGLATVALAHAGVKDERVMAWMAGMKDMGADTKVLVQMARGTVAFDADAAAASKDALASEARRIVPLFETKADDPKSESKPTVWSEFDAFTRLSEDLEAVIAAADVSTPDGVKAAAREIGTACAACHDRYRE